jgi:hypothetical protein
LRDDLVMAQARAGRQGHEWVRVKGSVALVPLGCRASVFRYQAATLSLDDSS